MSSILVANNMESTFHSNRSVLYEILFDLLMRVKLGIVFIIAFISEIRSC